MLPYRLCHSSLHAGIGSRHLLTVDLKPDLPIILQIGRKIKHLATKMDPSFRWDDGSTGINYPLPISCYLPWEPLYHCMCSQTAHSLNIAINSMSSSQRKLGSIWIFAERLKDRNCNTPCFSSTSWMHLSLRRSAS